MNRNVAVLVALALFVAHLLTVADDWAGGLAPPYDRAHVGYALARHMVFQGRFQLPGSEAGLEVYPSFLWVLVALVPERLFVSVTVFCQTIGVMAGILTLILSARRPTRGAELVLPFLLAVSGGVAAASMNGMETTLAMLLVLAMYRAFEHRHPRLFVVCAVLALLTHALAWVLLLVLLVYALFAPKEEEGSSGSFARYPIVALVLATGILLAGGGRLPSPRTRAWLDLDLERLTAGANYIERFARECPASLLVVFPLAALVRGRLNGTGWRSLGLALAWFTVVLIEGGDRLPFYEALVPVLPLLYLAIQQGLKESLDGGRASRAIAIGAFFLGVVFTALASKAPTESGPVALQRGREFWLGRFDFLLSTAELGRQAQVDEIRRVERLRSVAIALRESRATLGAETSILSPWPGGLIYLSGMRVLDPERRTIPRSPRPWAGPPAGELLTALEEEPTFILHDLDFVDRPPRVERIAERLIEETIGASPNANELGEKELHARVLEHLAGYESSALPVYVHFRGPRPVRPEIFYLLRRRDDAVGPALTANIERDDGRPTLRVELRHRGHHQLVRLRIQVEDERGMRLTLRPDGTLSPLPAVYARTGIELYDTGERVVRLLETELPLLGDGQLPTAARVQLFHPGRHDAEPHDAASPELRIPLTR